jgi:hypothetical protein
MMNITKVSPLTGFASTMALDVTPEQLERWHRGELIQDVMPHLSADEREFLMTGFTVADWLTMMGGDDDSDSE